MSSAVLDAPCRCCGYNGPGYWQAGTHAPACPWRTLAGEEARQNLLRRSGQKIRPAATRGSV